MGASRRRRRLSVLVVVAMDGTITISMTISGADEIAWKPRPIADRIGLLVLFRHHAWQTKIPCAISAADGMRQLQQEEKKNRRMTCNSLLVPHCC